MSAARGLSSAIQSWMLCRSESARLWNLTFKTETASHFRMGNKLIGIGLGIGERRFHGPLFPRQIVGVGRRLAGPRLFVQRRFLVDFTHIFILPDSAQAIQQQSVCAPKRPIPSAASLVRLNPIETVCCRHPRAPGFRKNHLSGSALMPVTGGRPALKASLPIT